jgi:hypothetical protein
MSHTAKLVAELFSRIQVQGSPATKRYGSRSSYPKGAVREILSGARNISRRLLMKMCNVAQLLPELKLKEVLVQSGNKKEAMKQYLVHFRVLFLAFAWDEYHLTKIVGIFVKIRTSFVTNTEVRQVVG